MQTINPRCFLDVSIGSDHVGRIVIELYKEQCPKTVENFRSLCTGESGIGEKSQKELSYQGCCFHRVIRGFMCQTGDFVRNDGKGGESIYGGVFDDENFINKHEQYSVSMANKGPNTNASQFFILTAAAPHLDGKNVVFGRVVKGFDVIDRIEDIQVDESYDPKVPIVISRCGELELRRPIKKVKRKLHKKTCKFYKQINHKKDCPHAEKSLKNEVKEIHSDTESSSDDGNHKQKRSTSPSKRFKPEI